MIHKIQGERDKFKFFCIKKGKSLKNKKLKSENKIKIDAYLDVSETFKVNVTFFYLSQRGGGYLYVVQKYF